MIINDHIRLYLWFIKDNLVLNLASYGLWFVYGYSFMGEHQATNIGGWAPETWLTKAYGTLEL